MNISDFVSLITHSRKRTGLVYLSEKHILDELLAHELEIIDLSTTYNENVILSENELYNLINETTLNKAVVLLNLEMFLSIRYQEPKYLSFLVSKLCQLEPLKPVFFGFYSKILYEKFKSQYLLSNATDSHFYEDYF